MVPEGNRTERGMTIVGLGNDLLSDDGVGLRAVRELKKRLSGEEITFVELSLGGLALLESIENSRYLVIIDAMVSGIDPPGTITRFVQTADDRPLAFTSSHQIDLGQVLSFSRLMGARVPDQVTVYAIEAEDVTTFHESCTPAVTRAIPRLVEQVCRDLKEGALSGRRSAGQVGRATVSV